MAETAASREAGAPERGRALTRALHLEYLTVGWNVVEAAVALTAAALSGSVALLSFGADSVVESASGGVMAWRLSRERGGADPEAVEAAETRAQKLVAASLVALAAYVAYESITALAARETPQPTVVGLALAAASLVVMWWLARQKRRAADALGSRALEADAFHTDACFWLSLFLLAGVGLNALMGWWWADPLAALAMVWPILSEAREAWEGDED